MQMNRDYVQAVMQASPTADLTKVSKYVWAKICDDPVWLKSFVAEVVEHHYQNIASDERAAKRLTRPTIVTMSTPTPAPAPRVLDTSRDEAKSRGRDRFTQNREAIEQMRFANGRGILDQTVGEAQGYGGWFVAIMRALPKRAKTTDKLGAYLSLDQLTKLRTFNVNAA